MKIIHVAGWSGSGKTTFIRDLIKALVPMGKVGSVKHIGDHICEMPAGKDTTLHFEAGASVTAGIDLQKTMITSRSVRLADSLDILANAGVRYAVVEGFKKVPFSKVVFGDLNVPALIRNPAVEDAMSHLDEFDDYYTLSGLIQEMDNDSSGNVRYCLSGGLHPDALNVGDCQDLETAISQWDGILTIRIRVNRPIEDVPGRFFVVCHARHPEYGTRALSRCCDFFAGAGPDRFL
jgi:molybdopterin-guanine dinucleotide biosynthesis protein MobB